MLKDEENDVAVYSQRYNKIGEKISLKDWWELAGDDDYCTIARDKLDSILIATEWTGKDYFEGMRNQRPLIFVTEIFHGREQIGSFYYNNEVQAFHTHQKLTFLADQKELLNYLGA